MYQIQDQAKAKMYQIQDQAKAKMIRQSKMTGQKKLEGMPHKSNSNYH